VEQSRQSQTLKLEDKELALLFEMIKKTQVPIEIEDIYQSLRKKTFDLIKTIEANEKTQEAPKLSRNGKK